LSSRFESQSDFIRIESKEDKEAIGRRRGWKETTKEERDQKKEDVKERNLDDKIRSVASAIKNKIYDHKNLYFVIEAELDPESSKLAKSLGRLGVTIRDYLDETHMKVLVSTSEEEITEFGDKKLPYYVKEPILDIRELKADEQLSKSLQNSSSSESKMAAIRVMPNDDVATSFSYQKTLQSLLHDSNYEVEWSSEPEYGLVLSRLTPSLANAIIEKSNIVFKVEEVPEGNIQRAKRKEAVRRKSGAVASSISESPGVVQNSLPKVCVADSGVNTTTVLAPNIVLVDHLPQFPDGVDTDWHGTPVSLLTTFGEGNAIQSRANIISYRIWSSSNRLHYLAGMLEAIRRYSGEARVFISSINAYRYDTEALAALAVLDRMIQEKNICFVSSSGNIPSEVVVNPPSPYPSYIGSPGFESGHPSQNAHVISVGSYVRRSTGTSVAQAGQISPFSRCGKRLPMLYDVQKPDLCEHGGNVSIQGGMMSCSGMGVQTYSNTGRLADFAGTSFSAPLVAGRLSEIVAKYGNGIQNAETLKAILLMSCGSPKGNCFGNGVPDGVLTADQNHAVFFSEGEMGIQDLADPDTPFRLFSRFSIPVPRGVGRISMCLVHSDNLHSISQPSLDTYLTVRAWKTARERSWVEPNNREVQLARTYVKFPYWAFDVRSMEGDWNFQIIAQPTRGLHADIQSKLRVRYGCVVELASRTSRLYPLTNDVIRMMNRSS
jgi:Subtilase family